MAVMVRLKTNYNDALESLIICSLLNGEFWRGFSWDHYADPALIHCFYWTRLPFKVKDSLH
jgi:hypothetical protein